MPTWKANGTFTVTAAYPNLTFQGAIAVRPVPGTTRLWVIEREGRIWSFEDDPATTTKTLVLDLNDDDVDTADGTPNAGHLSNASGGHMVVPIVPVITPYSMLDPSTFLPLDVLHRCHKISFAPRKRSVEEASCGGLRTIRVACSASRFRSTSRGSVVS